jgi:2-aminoadipate transaminase
MIENLPSLFCDLMRDFEGYAIGKTLKFLRDPSIISFAGGLPSSEMFPTALIRRTVAGALEHDAEKVLQYAPITGDEALMDAVIAYLKKDNIHIQKDNIMITTSGQHGLDLVGRLFLNPGDTVIADLPTFAGALVAFSMESPEVLGLPIASDGSDVDGMEQTIGELIRGGRKPKFIYVVPDFQNPSGITLSLDKRLKLLDLSDRFNIPIVEDSPYRELRYLGEHIPSIYSLDEQGGHVIGVYTFSKLMCPGIRVGFNIGPPEAIEKFAFIKGANILCTPKLNQDICTAFLEQPDLEDHFCRCRAYYRDKLNFFLEMMETCFPRDMGVHWTRPEGGLFLWITVPDHINTAELFFNAIEEKVAFVPGSDFYPKGKEVFNAMRVNFSYPSPDQIREGLSRLSTVIKKRL